MSLLEDVFLQDEAREAEELERVIEGDEVEERRRSDSDENSEKEDEAEEDKRRVDPTKTKTIRVVKNPRFILNPARLTGPRGIQVIPEHFKDFKFKGKGHEKEDLDLVLKKLEHWAYRLYPKFQFEDCLRKIEMLGKKRPVAVHLHKIRSDQFLSEDAVVQKDSSDEEAPTPLQEEDEFDKLLQQQIELARSTPAPNSTKKLMHDGPMSPKDNRITSLMMPKATSSPSINEEQRERMLRSRKLAEERRLARLKSSSNTITTECRSDLQHDVENSEANVEQNGEVTKNTDEIALGEKQNKSNVIDSSDEETEIETSVSIAVDVHAVNNITDDHKHNQDDMRDNNSINSDKVFSTVNENIVDVESTVDSNIINGNKLIKANVENSMQGSDCMGIDTSNVNKYETGSLNEIDNASEKSGENGQLKYDDSDMNIDENDHNTSDVNAGNLSNDSCSNATHKGNFLDILNNTERTNNFDDERSPIKRIQSQIVTGDNDKSNVVTEQNFEDIMDLDFAEDF